MFNIRYPSMTGNHCLIMIFLLKASSALPGIDYEEDELTNIFYALKHQRNRWRVNQQLVEWRL